MGGGVVLGVGGRGVVVGRGVLVGRGLCSWALSEKLNAIVVISIAKNLFMLYIPSNVAQVARVAEPADYNLRIRADDTES
jgi:hypothetical protein